MMIKESDLLIQGIEQFNRRNFFESHDIWESLWNTTGGTDRIAIQGLIQLAVGYYHAGNGKYHAAYSQLSKGLTKIIKNPPTCFTINIEFLTRKTTQFIAMCEALALGKNIHYASIEYPTIHLM